MAAVDDQVSSKSRRDPIPRLIKRNMIFFATSQAVVGGAFQLIPALAGLIMLRMTGSYALVGFAWGITGLTRVMISYPTGKIADGKGRRAAIIMGLLLLICGGLLIFYSVLANIFWGFIAGLMLHGLGTGAAHHMRIAAADMFPVERKAEGVSYVLTGSIFGALAGPLLIAYATAFSKQSQLDSYATPWLFTPLLAVVAAVLIFFARPDPREIAQNLRKYYPNMPQTNIDSPNRATAKGGRVLPLLSYYPIIAAILVTSVTWGNMSMMMSLASVLLNHHGFDLVSISVSVTIHTLGMFGLSVPIGRLADRWGRRRMLILGSIISGISGLMTPLSEDYWVITLGMFLVGLGWSAAIISSTAIVGDVTPPLLRGRMLGVIEVISGISTLGLPIMAGHITNISGFLGLGLTGLLLALPALLVSVFLREKSPGIYDYELVPLHKAPELSLPK